jgi:transcriptional regulator with XRE-family HTH domain
MQVGLTQGDLATRAGINQPYISTIESGAQNITAATAATLASALGLELCALLLKPMRVRQPRRPRS